MKIPVHEIKKIAIFRALKLGDMLCVIPALRALNNAYPKATITLLGLPWAESLTQRFPKYIHAFRHFPGYPGLPEQEFAPKEFTAFLNEVQLEEYDLVLQMQGNGTIVNPMVELLGGKFTGGFCVPNDYCPNKEYFLRYPEGLHEIERHLALMNHLGIESQGTHLEFPLFQKDEEEHKALGFLLEPKEYVCIHPGSAGAYRQWPPEYFAAVANYCERQGLTIVLTGTAEEIEIIEKVRDHLPFDPVIAAGKTSIGATALLIQNALMLVSNCTGVSHIASALQTPSFIISMDGEPERWGPMDKEIHQTIDWMKNPDYTAVFAELKDFLEANLQRQHGRDRVVTVTTEKVTGGI